LNVDRKYPTLLAALVYIKKQEVAEGLPGWSVQDVTSANANAMQKL